MICACHDLRLSKSSQVDKYFAPHKHSTVTVSADESEQGSLLYLVEYVVFSTAKQAEKRKHVELPSANPTCIRKLQTG